MVDIFSGILWLLPASVRALPLPDTELTILTISRALLSKLLHDIHLGCLGTDLQGCVLVLCALRSMTWYRFNGPRHYLLHLPQILLGIALSMLGFLDLGPKKFDLRGLDRDDHFVEHVNPLYRVLLEKAPLVIVAVVYFVVWLITTGGLWWDERRSDRAGDGVAGEEGGGYPEVRADLRRCDSRAEVEMRDVK